MNAFWKIYNLGYFINATNIMFPNEITKQRKNDIQKGKSNEQYRSNIGN